jgi:hypothetical protein
LLQMQCHGRVGRYIVPVEEVSLDARQHAWQDPCGLADCADALEAGAVGDLPFHEGYEGPEPTASQALRPSYVAVTDARPGHVFTSTTTTDLLWQSALGVLTSGKPVIVDPACGAANVLLPTADDLAVAATERSPDDSTGVL